MLEELDTTRSLLDDALNKYIGICSTHKINLQAVVQSSVRVQDLLKQAKHQLQLIDSYYQEELDRAKAPLQLRQVLNSSPTVSLTVPVALINNLPPEIMLRIFNFVVSTKSAVINEKKSRWTILNLPKHLDRLSRVCSRWRQIALASPTLWSRIDLAHHHRLGRRLVARAKEYVTRARHLPLDILIVAPYFDLLCKPADIGDLSFLPPATPIRSLEMFTYRGLYDSYFVSLGYCFKNCAPGQLEQLTIWGVNTGGLHNLVFLESTERPQQHDSKQLDISESHLEAVFARISVLRLRCVYIRWSSKAYHNLAELRLGSDSIYSNPTISESQIVEIMKSSRRLRIFHFSLPITESLPMSSPVLPVHLDDLEDLNLRTMKGEELEKFIRWIEPGAKPLQLSVRSCESASEQLDHFLTHSNVTRLRLVSPHQYSLIHFLSLVPQLRVLVISGYYSLSGGPIIAMPEYTPYTNLHLEALYIMNGSFKRTELQELIERNWFQRLVFWDIELDWEEPYNEKPNIFRFLEELPGCPPFTYLTREDPNPTSDWENFSGLCDYHCH
ncbi:F-box-like domain containing protein [Ceratobasidium theobromae]|uniref:F-box-like domain containing protein n=1 Tax=Ceratobasidium theobromae TaxID=1582974 RepID=A0A5N5QHA3_9AGAM|nr:F-box-like domain containing protein [Ceratobasidium theobromae]